VLPNVRMIIDLNIRQYRHLLMGETDPASGARLPICWLKRKASSRASPRKNLRSVREPLAPWVGSRPAKKHQMFDHDQTRQTRQPM
jgi:hypothetical protein